MILDQTARALRRRRVSPRRSSATIAASTSRRSDSRRDASSSRRRAASTCSSNCAAADYLHYPNAKDRYGVWYVLLNTTTGLRLWVKTFANDPEPTVPSVYPLWRGADWMEREVYDMYGVVFDGHPDLRRILMPDEFTAFPLRKDYPLRGRGERHNFPVITRAES